jgi:hypothetical protein
MDALHTVLRLSGGRFTDELAEALKRVADEVMATGNDGSVAVSLKITRPSNDPSIVINTSIKANLPKSPSLATMLFVDEEGFHAFDPRQAALPEFREVGGTESSVRDTEVEEADYREVSNDE